MELFGCCLLLLRAVSLQALFPIIALCSSLYFTTLCCNCFFFFCFDFSLTFVCDGIHLCISCFHSCYCLPPSLSLSLIWINLVCFRIKIYVFFIFFFPVCYHIISSLLFCFISFALDISHPYTLSE